MARLVRFKLSGKGGGGGGRVRSEAVFGVDGCWVDRGEGGKEGTDCMFYVCFSRDVVGIDRCGLGE